MSKNSPNRDKRQLTVPTPSFYFRVLLTFGLLVIGQAGFAAGSAAIVEPIGGWEIARVSGGLLVVLVAIVATAAGLKRLKTFQGTAGGNMRIVEGLSLGTRDRLLLVEIDNERILLGVSPGRIHSLHVCSSSLATEGAFAEMIEREAHTNERFGEPEGSTS